MLRRFLNRIVITIFLMGNLNLSACLSAAPCDEQYDTMPDDAVPSTLGVTVSDIEASLNPGATRRNLRCG